MTAVVTAAFPADVVSDVAVLAVAVVTDAVPAVDVVPAAYVVTVTVVADAVPAVAVVADAGYHFILPTHLISLHPGEGDRWWPTQSHIK